MQMFSIGILAHLAFCGSFPDWKITRDSSGKLQTRLNLDFPALASVGLSNDALDFLSRLLDYNVVTRLSAPEAMQHAWFASAAAALSVTDISIGL